MNKIGMKLMITCVVGAALASTTLARPHGGPGGHGMGPRPGIGMGHRPGPGPRFGHHPGPGPRFGHHPGPGPRFCAPPPRPFHRPPPRHFTGWRRGCRIHPHYRSVWVGDIWYDAYGYPCYSPSYLAVTPVPTVVAPGVCVRW